ncbi:MAG: Gfo/Idh/MocA family oxidoreductase [Candidatus Omnitrophota bacterium]
MKILLVGCGSIGRRHLENLNQLSEVSQIFVYSKVKHCLDCLEDKHKVSMVKSLNAIQPDVAIIANETNRHINTAVILAKKGIHLFVEKPLAHNLSGKLELLKKIIKLKKIKLGVGYNLRFLGAFEFIKTKLSQGAIGKIYFAKIEVGQYLPFWRSKCDYSISYSASKKRGGGVALDLSHEIDYMRFLFGDPNSCKVAKAKVSSLKIDSEDVFEGIYVYDNFICNVHMDYLQKNKKRVIRIEGEKGELICDLINKKIVIDVLGKKTIVSDKKLFDLDKTYKDEIFSFIKSVKFNRKPAVTFEDGVKVLKLIEA